VCRTPEKRSGGAEAEGAENRQAKIGRRARHRAEDGGRVCEDKYNVTEMPVQVAGAADLGRIVVDADSDGAMGGDQVREVMA
jgi:hypothetical protein